MRTYLFLIIIAVYVAASIPFLHQLLLSFDEAHYALYGYYPALSYFDHPPLVGWVQLVMQKLFSSTSVASEFFLRLPAVLSSVGVLIALWFSLDSKNLTAIPGGGVKEGGGVKASLVNEATPDKKTQEVKWIIAFILFLSCPVFFGLGFVFLPDSLVLLLTLPIMLQTRKAARSDGWLDYLILGILLGVCGLAKYTALLLAISASIYILMYRGWGIVITLRPWITLMTALLIFSPVIIWNIQHSGASFTYQLAHGFARNWLDWVHILIAQISQMVAYMPLVYFFGLAAGVWALVKKRREFYINLVFAIPPFIILAISPAFGKFLPHWIAYMFLLLLPVAASMIYELGIYRLWKGPKRRFELKIALVICLILSFAVILPLRMLVSGFEVRMPPYFHPWGYVVGWDETSNQIIEDSKIDPQYNVVFTNGWYYASSLAWYARPMKVIPLDKRIDQFDVWFGSPQVGQSGYLVVPHYDRGDKEKFSDFSECEDWKSNTYYVKGNPILTLDVYKCRGLLSRY